MEKTRFTAIILAAGKGTRMKSPLPKVLHPVQGVPVIKKVIAAARAAGVSELRVVIGYAKSLVEKIVEPMGGTCFVQEEQKGTADAVKSAKPQDIEGNVIILNGDHPLITAEDIKSFIKTFEEEKPDLAVVTANLENPGSYGRIVRHKGDIKAIVEAKDASQETLKIAEINTGIYIVKAEILNKFLPLIKPINTQGEFYLTDLISLCVAQGNKVIPISGHKRVTLGINTQEELAHATKILFRKKASELMAEGVIIIDPLTTYIEEDVTIGAGSVIYPGVYVRGKSKIGPYCVLEPNCYIIDSKLEDGVQVRTGAFLEMMQIPTKRLIPPYSVLQPIDPNQN